MSKFGVRVISTSKLYLQIFKQKQSFFFFTEKMQSLQSLSYTGKNTNFLRLNIFWEFTFLFFDKLEDANLIWIVLSTQQGFSLSSDY